MAHRQRREWRPGPGAGLATVVAALALTTGCAAARQRSGEAGPEQRAQQMELSRQAQAAIDGSDWTTAQGLLQQLSASEPHSAEVQQRLGRVWQAEGRYDLAESAYRRALERDAEYPAALVGLGEVLGLTGRLTQGLEQLDAAIELDPSRAEAHLARGRLLESLGKPSEALAAYLRALQFEPTSRPAMIRVAALQLSRSRPELALARLDRLLELAPDDADARHQRGRTYLVLNRPDRAVADLQRAAELRPDEPGVHYDLAVALSSSQPDAALRAAERAQQLAPGWAEARDLTERLRR